MKLKYTNFLALLMILGTVASLLAIGILFPVHPLLAAPFALLAVACIAVFVKFVYHFIYQSPLGEIPDEEAKDYYRDDD